MITPALLRIFLIWMKNHPQNRGPTCMPQASRSIKDSLQEEIRGTKIPDTFKEAINSPEAKQWKAAVAKELDSLAKNKVYKLVPITNVPKDEKYPRHNVFKQKVDGRFKVRLLVQGRVQESGIDYGRSYAPVCRIGSVRTLLAKSMRTRMASMADGRGRGVSAVRDRQGRVGQARLRTRRKSPATGEIMVYKLERSL